MRLRMGRTGPVALGMLVLVVIPAIVWAATCSSTCAAPTSWDQCEACCKTKASCKVCCQTYAVGTQGREKCDAACPMTCGENCEQGPTTPGGDIR